MPVGIIRPKKTEIIDDIKLTDVEFIKTIFVQDGDKKILNPKYFKELTSEKQIKDMKIKVTDEKGIIYTYIGDQERLIKLFEEKNTITAYIACKGGTPCDTRTCNGVTYTCYCWDNGNSTLCMCPLCIELSSLGPIEEDTLSLRIYLKGRP